MCDQCENGVPIGGGVEDVRTACPAQLAESLRDAIRSVAYSDDGGKALDFWADDIDRYIDELVRRIDSQRGAE